MTATPRITSSLLTATLFLALLVLTPASQALAVSTLMVNPIRVVFEDRQRSATVSLANTDPEPVTYRISLVTMRRDAEGTLREVTEESDTEKLTKSLIRFSPRKATIEPHSRQIVKLMVRKPSGLPAGEYQTRLKFLPVHDENRAKKSDDSQGPRVKVDLIVAVTIPVIVQHGDLNVQVEPKSFALMPLSQAPSGLAARINLSRSGDCSAFGDVVVKYLEGGGKARMVGKAQSMGFYFPETSRDLILPLEGISDDQQKGGRYRVEFHPSTQKKGSSAVTSKEFNL